MTKVRLQCHREQSLVTYSAQCHCIVVVLTTSQQETLVEKHSVVVTSVSGVTTRMKNIYGSGWGRKDRLTLTAANLLSKDFIMIGGTTVGKENNKSTILT